MSDRLEVIKRSLYHPSKWLRSEPTQDDVRWLISEVERLRAIGCRGDDPTCPCHDGDACHYRGKDAWPTPVERELAAEKQDHADDCATLERVRAERDVLKKRCEEARNLLLWYDDNADCPGDVCIATGKWLEGKP